MGVKFTGKNTTKHFGQPYLLNFLDELNILVNAIENHLGLRYTIHLINFHHRNGFNAVCKCTDNLELLRLQPKRTKMQNIQKGMKNEGKRKESRLRQKNHG